MKLKIISDIHLEFPGARDALPEIVVNTDAIGLLGDIGNPLKQAYTDFLLEMSDKFSHVFVVPGNHEYYANEFQLTNQLIEKICAKRENIHCLNKATFDWGDEFRVIGTTLWSTAPEEYRDEIQSASTDHKKIITQIDEEYLPHPENVDELNLGEHWDKLQIHGTKFSIQEKVSLHEEQAEWIKEEVEKAKNENKKVIILTHHAPTSKKSLPWAVLQDKAAEYDSCTDMEGLLDEHVKLWGFGHTHYNCDQIINHTRVVSNQLGYVRRTNPTFDGALVLDLSLDDAELKQTVEERQKQIEEVQLQLDEEAEKKAQQQREKQQEALKVKETNKEDTKASKCAIA